jgi:hypothetical protein
MDNRPADPAFGATRANSSRRAFWHTVRCERAPSRSPNLRGESKHTRSPHRLATPSSRRYRLLLGFGEGRDERIVPCRAGRVCSLGRFQGAAGRRADRPRQRWRSPRGGRDHRARLEITSAACGRRLAALLDRCCAPTSTPAAPQNRLPAAAGAGLRLGRHATRRWAGAGVAGHRARRRASDQSRPGQPQVPVLGW